MLIFCILIALMAVTQEVKAQRAHIKEIQRIGNLVCVDSIPFTGEVYDFYDNGKKKLEIYYKEGLRNGSYKKWYPDGTLMIQGTFVNDDTVGVFTVRYPNSQKRWEGNYNEQGLKHGELTKWYSDGTKRTVYLYENGKLVMKWLYKEGKVISKKKVNW